MHISELERLIVQVMQDLDGFLDESNFTEYRERGTPCPPKLPQGHQPKQERELL